MAFLGALTRSLCPFGGVRRPLDVAIKEMSHQWLFFQSCSWLMCAGVPRSSGFSPPHQDVPCGAVHQQTPCVQRFVNAVWVLASLRRSLQDE